MGRLVEMRIGLRNSGTYTFTNSSPMAGAAPRMQRFPTFLVLSLFVAFSAPAHSAPSLQPQPGRAKADPAIEARVEALLAQMTLEEKVGQLNFPSYAFPSDAQLEDVKKGRIGAMLNVANPEHVAKFKVAAKESRLKIPL